MRQFNCFVKELIASGAISIALLSGLSEAADDLPPLVPPRDGAKLVAQKPMADQPAKPEQPPVPEQPPRPELPPLPEQPPRPEAATPGPAPRQGLDIGFGNVGGGGTAAAAVSQPQAEAVTATPSETISGEQALPRASTDVGDLLSKSQSAPGVDVQHRNPVITDVRVRGYHVGQLDTFLDGGFLFPARYDLDTAVSKIDSHLIRDTVVLKGPYSVRLGPGFAFLSVETLGSPRYDDGFEAHGLTGLSYKTNGSQWRGRQAFWGGDQDWGFRIGYDLMSGDDYSNARGVRVPSGYNSQNLDAAFGFDLNADNHLEFRLLRQDQHDVQLPGQAFDLTNATTDFYTARYVLDGHDYFDRFTAEGWYSYSRFNGDNLRPAKRAQIFPPNPADPTGQLTSFTGVTDGDVETPGYRTFITWGQEKSAQVSVGTDLRYVTQHLNEFDTILASTVTNTIPRSHLVDPGVFIDGLLPLLDSRLLLKAGFRADWATADIDSLPTDQPVPLSDPTVFGRPGPYNRDFNLWSAYLTSEFQLTDHWTAMSGAGTALRPPTTTELYAIRPLMAVIQNGFSFTTGNPNLNPEQLRQLDLGIRCEYDTFRFGLSGYYAWIHDYITFEETAPPLPPAQFNSVRFINTNRAALSGFESYGEWDVAEWLTPFVVMSYVEGRDFTRDDRPTITGQPGAAQEPLPGMPPFESTVGLRVHDARKTRWGVELSARLVAAQNRIAESLGEQPTPAFTVVNLRSYWNVTRGVVLTAGVENLTNTFYREALDLRTGLGVTQPGINFYFGTQLTY